MPKKVKNATVKAPKKTITFHFIKSQLFRDIPVHGAWGGISPQGDSIQMAVFSERRPIPTEITLPIDNNNLGKEIVEERKCRDGMVREIEANLFMNLQTAKAISSWLEERIKTLESILSKAPKKA